MMSHTPQNICKTSPSFSRSVGGNATPSDVVKTDQCALCVCLIAALCSPVPLLCQPPTLRPIAWWGSHSPTSPHWWLSSPSNRSSSSNEKVNSKSVSQLNIPVVLHVLAHLPQITYLLLLLLILYITDNLFANNPAV